MTPITTTEGNALSAQGQQPNAAKLKADVQKVVTTISRDKAKSQTYCHVLELSEELDQVDELKERRKADELSRKISELEKTLGPEYLELADNLKKKWIQPR